jgi:hypothetical protein
VRKGKGGRPATMPSPGAHLAEERRGGCSRSRGGPGVAAPHPTGRRRMRRGSTSTTRSTSSTGSRRGSTSTTGCAVAGDEGCRTPWGGCCRGGDGQIRYRPASHKQRRRCRLELKVATPHTPDLGREEDPTADPCASDLEREGEGEAAG